MARTVTTIIAILLTASLSHAADRFTGWWKANLAGLPVVIHITSPQSGFLYSPTQTSDSIPLSKVSVSADTIAFEAAALMLRYSGVMEGGAIKGSLIQGRRFPLEFTAATATDAALYRPQTPQPPYPYLIDENVVIATSDSTQLSATVTMPLFAKPLGGVVLVSGSGLQNRDEEIFGHKPFAVIADYLTRRGFCVLRYDDRGIGGSTPGKPGHDTTLDYAADALAALRHLRSLPKMQNCPAGFIGHSEGGAIALINAATAPDITDFAVTLAAPVADGVSLIVEQNRLIAANHGTVLPDSTLSMLREVFTMIAKAESITPALKDSIARRLSEAGIDGRAATASLTPWYQQLLRLDMSHYIPGIKSPTMMLFGELDYQVGSSLNEPEARRLAPDADVRIYPGLNHLFQTVPAPSQAMNYSGITETIAPQVLDDIFRFLDSLPRKPRQ